MIQGGDGAARRARLWNNVQRLDQVLALGTKDLSPIRPVVTGASETAMRLSEAVRDRGHHVPAIRFPTVPKGTARLRLSVSADHTVEQVDALGEILRELRPDRTDEIGD
jgi:7-keto-8-aminopelargonate synthetase-like enzyme